MAAIKYKVELTEAERSRLNERRGGVPARQGVSAHREAGAVAAQG